MPEQPAQHNGHKVTTLRKILTATIAAAGMTVAAIAVTACAGRDTSKTPAARPFPAVRVPEIYASDPGQGAAYAVLHFWDDLADTTRPWLNDSTHLAGIATAEIEQQYRNFAGLLEACSLDDAGKAMRRLYDTALRLDETASITFFDTLADRYLYNVNSPVRDEDIYAAWASSLARCDLIPPEKQSLYAYQTRLCALNRRGTPAADFEFRTARGETMTLSGITADYTLLFFSNPGCTACKTIIETLSGELNVGALIESGRLAVANIYIDEDLRAWYDYMPIYPDNWYNGYDPGLLIRGETLYNVRAIPSLYLLDRDKTVLLKDAPDEVIFNALASIARGRLQ